MGFVQVGNKCKIRRIKHSMSNNLHVPGQNELIPPFGTERSPNIQFRIPGIGLELARNGG